MKWPRGRTKLGNRSTLEDYCFLKLKEEEIDFCYECIKVTLVQGFVSSCPSMEIYGVSKKYKEVTPKIRPITYTPDFIGQWWMIETKGHLTPKAKDRWKLFKKYLTDNGIVCYLFMPRNHKQIDESIEIIKEIWNGEKIPTGARSIIELKA